jgi:hypothetical protein
MTSQTRSAGANGALSCGAAGLAAIALGLGACVAPPPPPPPQVGYLAPSGLPPVARTAVIQRPTDLVLGDIVDRLQQSSFTISDIDEEAGLIVVRYRGDPEPYVDCGWIVTYDPGELDRVPAATASASFDRQVEHEFLKLHRQLQLDGRMVVRLTPRGTGTVVSPTTTYVLTKSIDATEIGGSSAGQARQIISFGTGESATFPKGTRCQPNGRFERVVLDSLPATSLVATREAPATETVGEVPRAPAPPPPPASIAAPAPPVLAAPPPPPASRERRAGPREPAELSVAASPPASEPLDVAAVQARVDAVTGAMRCASVDAEVGEGNLVLLSGYVDSEQDEARLRQSLSGVSGVGAVESRLEVQPWPFCEILAVIDPYRSSDRQHGLVITTPDRETALREGDALTLDIFLPPDAEYLYLGYVQSDGRVGYITVLPVRQWVQDTGAIRFETGYEISPPFGREMIVAITSARPLFDEALPAYQAPEQYIAMLRDRLALRANDADAALDASHLIISTQPKPAF